MVSNILLELEQKELLIALVEAARNVEREKRQKFLFIQVMGGAWIQHDGLREQLNAYEGDIQALANEGLLDVTYNRSTWGFDVTPRGFKYYTHLKEQLGQPIQQIESSIRAFIHADSFQKKYPVVYQKWAEAEKLLWSTDSQQQLTTIGHLCREAVQEFATALVERYQPPGVTENKASTVARMKAVFAVQNGKIGVTVKPLLEALLSYWGAANDLIQRQEHGGQKEGQPLMWEDGRRVVFNTAIVMFEIANTLN